MHPAPTLAELLKSDDPRAQQQVPQQHQLQPQQEEHPRQHGHLQDQQLAQPPDGQIEHGQPPGTHSPAPLGSPQPIRKDTASSTSTTGTDATVTTAATSDSSSTAYSVESSQSIFSVRDGAEVSSNRRASRRRTGPLSAAQREKAALIRKLGACADCRRRRVACHPNHHNMTWEDAIKKYQRAHSPMQELAPLLGRPISPASNHLRHSYTQDPQEMDIDSTPTPPVHQTTPGRPPLGDSRIRTPLPSGPRPDRTMSIPSLAAAPIMPTALPNIDFVRSELETAASRLLSGPHSGRYSTVLALLICWQDDDTSGVFSAVEDLAAVFRDYLFTLEIIKIPPSSSDGCKNSARWLSRTLNDFTENNDTRDVLKIVYYNGCTYLDDGEMVLASPNDREKASIIKWSGIQDFLEGACSDTLVIFDAAYHPSSKMTRQQGVLELIAASASEEHLHQLGRNTFSRALAQQLRTRASQRSPNVLSAAELYSKLLPAYTKIVQEHNSDGRAASVPMPLHLQMSGNPKLPSITLYPLQGARPRTPGFNSEVASGPQLTLSIRLTDDNLNIENWAEWLRMMPDGIKDVRVVEGPFRTFR
ncbi:hypothetical protein JX265_000587 [Neoarthrinium moseri]|uniref:Uncharacterized protein n=1 Tax=Neoarthrinium moseri TaxID=1658444 RepID=A0A9Q0AVR0_9PEZI|nr:uncharacterized protein JN550_001659 [Neoarthrinium moseri]KAI1876163.1 hypothetical protein JN550_001659 [Neoarthrinium moseri]KAI1881761.1 hypothetical protein JX265_000587 [Neoarthrinium moseri]